MRYGTVDGGRTFVISYERVPLHDGSRDRTYTFQVLLRADGRIVFQYQSLAAPPSALAIGVQNTTSDFEVVGCGAEAALHDRLAIELRPQAVATSWLQLRQSDGLIQPAGQQPLGATLSWSPPSKFSPLRARIEIVSTDPTQPRAVIPLIARMLPAPHSFWIAPLAR